MDDLMFEFEMVLNGGGDASYKIFRIMQLRNAMETYTDLEFIEAQKLWDISEGLYASGAEDGAKTYQGLSGRARASAIVGIICMIQMEWGILGLVLGVF